MKKELKELGDRIKKRRLEVGLTQEQLSFSTSLHRTYIGSVERGERNVGFLNLIIIARALNVSTSELIKGIE